MPENKTGEVTMQTLKIKVKLGRRNFSYHNHNKIHKKAYFIATYQLIAVSQSRHQSSFLQPEYRRERPTEEDSFNCGERNDPFTKGCYIVRDPSQSPFSFLLDARHGFNGIKQELPGIRLAIRNHKNFLSKQTQIIGYLSEGSLIYVSISKLYISEWTFSMAI